MNKSLIELAPYASKHIAQMARSDPQFVNLSIGEPWFGPAPAALQALAAWRTENDGEALRRYAPSRGNPELRVRIAERHRRITGQSIDPETQVLVTYGGAQAFLLAVLAVTNPGDGVLVPDPTYMLYGNACTLLGRIPVPVAKSEVEGFVLQADDRCRDALSRCRLLVINSPENPTGTVYSASELASLYELCQQHGTYLLHDEVYDSFVFDGSHQSAMSLHDGLDGLISLNSMSKRYGLPGLRIGWLIAEESVITLATKALEYSALAVCGIAQELAERIMADPDTEEWIGKTRRQVRLRRDELQAGLANLGFEFPPRGGAGGFFLFPNITNVRDSWGHAADSRTRGELMADWLARTAKIAVVPGSVYGSQGADHVRLVTTVEEKDIRLGLQRLGAALDTGVRAEVPATEVG